MTRREFEKKYKQTRDGISPEDKFTVRMLKGWRFRLYDEHEIYVFTSGLWWGYRAGLKQGVLRKTEKEKK